MSKTFIDTNILVYSLDQADPQKQMKARTLLKAAQTSRTGVLSTQVLQEFYVVATGKLKIEPALAKKITRSMANFTTVTVDFLLIEQAMDICQSEKLSFWDALIVAAASSAGCQAIWTEDLNHNQVVSGVEVINPFLPGLIR